MLNYRDTQNTLHTRLVDFSLQEYLFVLQTVLGEDPCVAYANIFDTENFKHNIPSEDEEEYLSGLKRDAEILLEQQNCKQLYDYINEEYQRDIQDKALNLQDVKFTSSDVQKILNGLLKDRTQTMSESSVKEVVSLIKSMYDSGAIDSGDADFEKHFITIPCKYNVLCSRCNHEAYAVAGLDFHCPNCGLVAKWSEADKRFFPELNSL